MNNGFSLWCDFIERGFLQKDFKDLLDKKFFYGATSNPAIFANALKNPIYQEAIEKQKGNNAKTIYENLAIEDIKKAGEIMLPLWEENKDNGYISLEIDPFLENKVSESIEEGKRLFKSINLPNVMIKVPATESGFEVMEALMRENIPVNATLIFSKKQARSCSEAFKSGRGSKDTRGVISVFVSRFDRAVDEKLDASLKGKLGILNAQDCYLDIESLGESYTRVLFASTGVKGDSLSKDYYINSLLHPHSINTAPLDTILSYYENPQRNIQTFIPSSDIYQELDKFKELGIDREVLGEKLLKEGLEAFKEAFEALLRSF
ncbi:MULTISPECIES: transaldolase [unclassified Helicobacter]|uniref:transaldolase n=1 Tax=unclassified Helicobacter TaxID=2593540 RepID=UPI000CF19051|nr:MULTISPECIES: transaldolase [unclassified Helicobacter]